MKKLMFFIITLSLTFSNMSPQAVVANSQYQINAGNLDPEAIQEHDSRSIRPGEEFEDNSQDYMSLSAVTASVEETQRQIRAFDCESVTDISEEECLALLTLYSSTAGDSWINNDNWLTSTTVSTWYGVDIAEASISLSNDSNIDEFGLGDTITYTLIAENTGDLTLSQVSIVDPLLSTTMTCTPAQPATLDPGETLECSGDYVPTQLDFDTGSISNIATVTAKDPAEGDVSAQAEKTLTAEKVASVDLIKTALPISYDEVGSVITYEFSAENTGNVTLSTVEINDPLVGLSLLDCQLDGESVTQPISLIPDQVLECEATYIITQDDLDNGEVSNIASVNAIDPDNEAVNDTANITISAGQTAALGLEKVATQVVAVDESILTQYASVGDRIDYSYTLTNIGNVTLYSPYTVTDNLITNVTCPAEPALLAPLETIECNASYTVDQADLDRESVTNIATATAMDAEEGGVAVVSTASSEEVMADQNPALIITKTATLINGIEPDPFVFNSVGDEITYAFSIENTGNLTFRDLRIVDTIAQVQGTPIDLAPGEVDTTSFSATYTITQDNLDAGVVNNTAWGLWPNDPTGTYIYSIVNESVSGMQSPALELSKTATHVNGTTPDPLVYTKVGDVITYAFSVENTGNVTLTDVNIMDPLTESTNLAVDPATLASGEIGTITADYIVTQADLDAGSITNTATAFGIFDSTEYSDDDETTIYGTQAPALELTKTATLINGGTPEPFEYTHIDDVITYSFSVENTGNVTLSDVNVTDTLTGSINLPVNPATLASGEIGTITATYTVTQADINNSSITNTATAYGTFDSTEFSDDDQTTISGTQIPALELTKTATQINGATPDPLVFSTVGDVITYTFSVQNTGNVALTDVNVSDALTGSTNLAINPAILNPGDTGIATADYTVTQADIDNGNITNTATAYGTFDSVEYTDDDEVITHGNQNPALELTKTATQVNGATPEPLEFSQVGDVITYSFSVENTGNVALTNVNVTDVMTGSTNLVVNPAVLNPGDIGTVTATYTVTQTDIDAGSIINTATAFGTFNTAEFSDDDEAIIWGNQTATLELTKTATLINDETPDPFQYSAIDDVITYTFAVENTGNVILTNVNITDTLTGSTNLAINPATLNPGDIGTATVTYTVTQTDIDAGSITNTATAYGTFDSTAYSDNDENTVYGTQIAALEITKTATLINDGTPEPFEYSAVDDVITYTFSVENTGNVTLTNVNVSDPLTGSANQAINPTTLGPGDIGTTTATYSITQADLDAGSITNTAIAYGYFNSTEYSDDVESTLSGTQTPTLELTKTATLINDTTPEPFEFSAVDDVITYTFSVENTGNVTLSNINITDALTGSTNLPVDPAILAPGETGVITATYTIVQADIDAGSITNTATAYGTFDSFEYADDDQITISASQTANLDLNRIANWEDRAFSKKVTAVMLPNQNPKSFLGSAVEVKAISQPRTKQELEVDPPVVNYYVRKLLLNDNNLIGSLPSFLSNLSLLEELNLKNNHLSGVIPGSIGSLIYLKRLILFSNQLTGPIPTGIGQLTRLVILDLGYNQLSGAIPTELANLVGVTQLYLDSNSLGGELPDQMSNLINLQYLRLSQNPALGGELPESLGELTQLKWLNIHYTNLSGAIPMSYIQLTQLEYFTFQETALCEPLNQDFIDWKASVPSWVSNDNFCIKDSDFTIHIPLIHR
ncbi:DUF11 domain-containing protein [bacterium]|nr:DUF11 domain-containing protein [bacterium]